MATPSYTPNNWEAGQILTAEKLNNTETGVSNAIAAIQQMEAPIVEVQTLAAGQQASVSFQNGKWIFGIPQGAVGPAGTNGTNGSDGSPGADGTNGMNGASWRVSATALKDDQSGIEPEALVPSNSVIPYAVGDLVLDATSKIIYQIVKVSDGSATIGTAVATLP